MTYLNKHDRADDLARAEAPYHDELMGHAATLRALRASEEKVRRLEAELDGPSPLVRAHLKVKAQRDALLAACETVWWGYVVENGLECHPAFEQMQNAAIAAAKAQP